MMLRNKKLRTLAEQTGDLSSMEGSGIGVTGNGMSVSVEIRANPICTVIVGNVGRVIYISIIAYSIGINICWRRQPTIVLPAGAVPFL